MKCKFRIVEEIKANGKSRYLVQRKLSLFDSWEVWEYRPKGYRYFIRTMFSDKEHAEDFLKEELRVEAEREKSRKENKVVKRVYHYR